MCNKQLYLFVTIVLTPFFLPDSKHANNLKIIFTQLLLRPSPPTTWIYTEMSHHTEVWFLWEQATTQLYKKNFHDKRLRSKAGFLVISTITNVSGSFNEFWDFFFFFLNFTSGEELGKLCFHFGSSGIQPPLLYPYMQGQGVAMTSEWLLQGDLQHMHIPFGAHPASFSVNIK